MIKLSVDIVWSLGLLLKRIIDYNLQNIDDIYLSSISPVNIDVLIEIAVTCKWIEVDGSLIEVNERSYEIANASNFEEQAREILKDYIKNVSPIWSKRIPYGRKEAFLFMSKDEQACFYEAGLMKAIPKHKEIEWWDILAAFIRRQDDMHKNLTGRRGEYCTIVYERARIGRDPQWVSIESNLSGYDIISCVSDKNEAKLLIEVKSSELSITFAEFYVSANEWHVACNTENYCFYLWSFYNDKKYLAKIDSKTILPYVPTNNKTGEWQSVRIPFKSFIQFFKEIA